MLLVNIKKINIPDLIKDLKNGKTLVYPTETCYGLGCVATNGEAIEKVFAIKQRIKEKSLLCLFANLEMAKEYVPWNETLDILAKKYWPGPLTIIAKIKENYSKIIKTVDEKGFFSFRVPGNNLSREIVELLGKPLVSTSANISNSPNPYDVETIVEMFSLQINKPDIIIDAGKLPEKKPTTIVKVDGGKIEVVRQGDVFVSLVT